LSDAAVQNSADRGIDVDFQPKLGEKTGKALEIIGNYDVWASRSGRPK